MFKPLEYTFGFIWGAVTAPFKWVWNGIGGALTGGVTGGIWGAGGALALQLLGEPVMAALSSWMPALGEAAWFESIRHFAASTTFVEKLAFLAPAGAAIGGTVGLVSTIPQTISENQQVVPTVVDPVTQERVTVNGLERGQNHGVVIGSALTAVGLGAVLIGAARQFGLLGVSGGEEATEARAQTVPVVMPEQTSVQTRI